MTPYNQYFIKSYDYRYIFVPCRSYKGQVHLFIIRLKGEKKHALLNFTKSKYVCKSPMYMSSTSPVILRSRVTTSAILFKSKIKGGGGRFLWSDRRAAHYIPLYMNLWILRFWKSWNINLWTLDHCFCLIVTPIISTVLLVKKFVFVQNFTFYRCLYR